MEEEERAIRRITFPDAAQGKEIYNFFGNKVLEHTSSSNIKLAIKVKPNDAMDRSEADMMQYAASHGVLAPQVRGVYDILVKRPIARAMVSTRAAGVSLDQVWFDLSEAEKSSIISQLRVQVSQMRKCKQIFVGRVGRQHTRNVYDRIVQTYCGPFDDIKTFENWCLARIDGPLKRWKWQRFLDKESRDYPREYTVLTHGDLTPRNIIVEGSVMTGIVDWERSGFYPDYAEYAFAMKLCHSHEKWWIPVLKDILEPCSDGWLEFTKMAENRGF